MGDWVGIDGREGVVSDITLMSTRIQAFNGEYVVVPNDVVGSSTVTNRSRQQQLRIEVDVGIDYDDENVSLGMRPGLSLSKRTTGSISSQAGPCTIVPWSLSQAI